MTCLVYFQVLIISNQEAPCDYYTILQLQLKLILFNEHHTVWYVFVMAAGVQLHCFMARLIMHDSSASPYDADSMYLFLFN